MDIKTLNDKFRKTLLGGKVMLTRGRKFNIHLEIILCKYYI